MINFDLNNYVVVDNFISKERATDLWKTFADDIQNNPSYFEYDVQCPNSPASYNYLPFLELLCEKTNEVTKAVGQTVLPTYCYARLYKHGEILHPHTDRPSCETSLTVHLGGDKDWAIWITKPNGEEISITLQPGQAVMYKGMISRHWREAFQGTEYAQVFLHYVKSRQENAEHYFDRIKTAINYKNTLKDVK